MNKFREQIQEWKNASDVMGISDLPIVELAKMQRQRFAICYLDARNIKDGFVKCPKKIRRIERLIQRELADALSFESVLIQKALERPEDIEDFANYDLVGAIANLTQSRVNRLAYAGRVLP